MNAATAGGMLGGKADGVTTTAVTEKGSGAVARAGCSFELRRDATVSRLSMDVITMQVPRTDFAAFTARCPSGATPLKAMGNEAIACGGADHGERWESVVGRVRDQAFIVRLSTNDAAVQDSQLRDRARKTADLIASGLF